MEFAINRVSIILIATVILLTVNTFAIANIPGATAMTGVGGRSAVFDEAFVAIADDSSAIYWNPAGLMTLRDRWSSTLSHNSLFTGLFGLTGIRRDFLSFAYSRRYLGIGLCLDELGTSRVIETDNDGKILSEEGRYSERRISFSLSTGSTRIASIGLTGNYFHIGSATSSDDFSVDLGILSRAFLSFHRPQSGSQLRLRVGTTIRNLYHSLDISPQYSLAAALQYRTRWGLLSGIGGSSLTFALAYANNIAPNRTPKFALGMELGPDAPSLWRINHAKIHFGVEYYPSVTDSFDWKMGLRIGGNGLWFNYVREQARFLGGSDRATIEFGFKTNLIQDVVVGKIEGNATVKRSDLRYETTDEIAIIIYLLNNLSFTEIQRLNIQLLIRDSMGKDIEKVNYDEMDLTNVYMPRHVFQPVDRWFKKRGYIQPGEYAIEIQINGETYWKEEKFKLRYDFSAQQIVENARQMLIEDLKAAEDELLKSVKLDPSYPEIYYIAGLISELSADFIGAKECYIEAQKLKLNRVINDQHLPSLIEQQERQKRPGIKLHEKLQQASRDVIE